MSDYLGSPSSEAEAMLRVFSNDLLLETILGNFVYYNGHPAIASGTRETRSNDGVFNSRLVSKHWMETLTKLYRKNQAPLFHLKLDHSDSLDMMDSERFPNQGTLKQFTTCMAHWEGPEPSKNYPRFELELTPTFFHMANEAVFKELFVFLIKFASHGMVRFTFNFDRTKFQYIPMCFPQFQFNNLREVVLIIDKMALAFVPLIQKLLGASTSLESLNLRGSSCFLSSTVACLAPIIESIARKVPYVFQLPKTIKNIALYGTIDTCSCFYRIPMNDLENLKTFTMSASPCLLAQVEETLASIAGQVKSLNFVGFISCVFSFQRMYHLRFPVMKNLETLTVNMPWDFTLDSQLNYEINFPNLKQIVMVNRELELDCLLNGYPCKTLEKLTVVTVIPFVYSEHGHRTSCPKMDVTKLDMIQGIKTAFVNLIHLEIGMSGTQTAALKEIFSSMLKLKTLTIYVDTGARFKTQISWDAIFTGLSTLACKALLESGKESWNNWEILDEEKYPSIRALKDLEALYLVETSYPGCRAYCHNSRGRSSIAGHGLCNFDEENLPATTRDFSGLSFHFSFFKMPKLKTLMCTKGFMPNDKIQQWWTREKGTFIKTLRSPKLYHLITNKFSVFDKTWRC